MSKITRNQKKKLILSTIFFVVCTPIIFLVSSRQVATTISAVWIGFIFSTWYVFSKQAKNNKVEKSNQGNNKIPYVNKEVKYFENIRNNRADMVGVNHYLGYLMRYIDFECLRNVKLEIAYLKASNSYYIFLESKDRHTNAMALALEAALNCTLKYQEEGSIKSNYRDYTHKLLFEGYATRTKITEAIGRSAAYANKWDENYPLLDYYTRLAIASRLECIFTVYRFMTTFLLNWPKKIAYLRVHSTFPESLCILTDDKKEQIRLSKDISLRDMALAAQLALEVNGVEKACVELIIDTPIGSQEVLKYTFETGATATFYKGDLDLLNKVILEGEGLAQDVFKYDYELDQNGLFKLKPTKERFNKTLQQTSDMYAAYPLHTCNNKEFMKMFFANKPSDLLVSGYEVALTIFEQVVNPLLDETYEGTIEALRKGRDATENGMTIEACNRTIKGIEEGYIDPADLDEICECFLFYHSTIEADIEDLICEVETGDADFSQLKKELDNYLESVVKTDKVLYIDPSCIAERIAYNRAYIDDSRRVEVLPDEYSNLLTGIIKAYINSEICDVKLIEPYVEKLIRIGNQNVYDINIISKFYVKNLEPHKAIKICKDALKYSVSKIAASYISYIAAWVLLEAEDIKTSVALYMLSIEHDSKTKMQAAKELSTVLSKNPKYKQMTKNEANKHLRENGWARSLKDSYRLCNQTPPAIDITYDELMKTGVVYSVDEGMYDLGRIFIAELPNAETDVINSIYLSLNQ